MADPDDGALFRSAQGKTYGEARGRRFVLDGGRENLVHAAANEAAAQRRIDRLGPRAEALRRDGRRAAFEVGHLSPQRFQVGSPHGPKSSVVLVLFYNPQRAERVKQTLK